MPQRCDGRAPASWSFGASVGGFDTDIVFPGRTVHTRQFATSASLGRALDPRLNVQLGAGYISEGEIADGEVRSGWAASAGASWLAILERRDRPFLVVTTTASVSRVRASADDGRMRSWTAGDGRLGAMAGKTFGPFVPYATVRVFGGPVFWRLGGANETGTDRRHVAAGVGLTFRLEGDADVTAEIIPAGERSAVLGVTVHR